MAKPKSKLVTEESREAFAEISEQMEAGRGKEPRLNRQRLELDDDKEYASVVLFGDLHWGHPGCNVERANSMLRYCLENEVYVLLMGDLIENGTRGSRTESVYEQIEHPHTQYEEVVELLTPLAESNLILGLINGNHEQRTFRQSGFDVSRMMARQLDVPYLKDACWNLWYVGDESYTIYARHGTTGSSYQHTKIAALLKRSHDFRCDLACMGHVHTKSVEEINVQEVDKARKKVVTHKKHHVLTGHYLNYDKSYPQRKGYPIGSQGSPKVKFFGDHHDIHVSL